MSEQMIPKSTYSEPTVLWRLRDPDGRTAHALIVPRWNDASAVWFINDVNQDGMDFDDWDSAVKWAEEVRAELEAEGWLAVLGDGS